MKLGKFERSVKATFWRQHAFRKSHLAGDVYASSIGVEIERTLRGVGGRNQFNLAQIANLSKLLPHCLNTFTIYFSHYHLAYLLIAALLVMLDLRNSYHASSVGILLCL